MELPKSDFAFVDSITNINFKPHPYTIGPKHVEAAQKYGGILDEEVIKEIKCAVPHCQLSYGQHTSDRVAFVKLTRNCSNEEMQEWLKDLVNNWIPTQKPKIDGFGFVETEEKFRIGTS